MNLIRKLVFFILYHIIVLSFHYYYTHYVLLPRLLQVAMKITHMEYTGNSKDIYIYIYTYTNVSIYIYIYVTNSLDKEKRYN